MSAAVDRFIFLANVHTRLLRRKQQTPNIPLPKVDHEWESLGLSLPSSSTPDLSENFTLKQDSVPGLRRTNSHPRIALQRSGLR